MAWRRRRRAASSSPKSVAGCSDGRPPSSGARPSHRPGARPALQRQRGGRVRKRRARWWGGVELLLLEPSSHPHPTPLLLRHTPYPLFPPSISLASLPIPAVGAASRPRPRSSASAHPSPNSTLPVVLDFSLFVLAQFFFAPPLRCAQKRKLLDEGLEQKWEVDIKELYEAMKVWVSEHQNENEQLFAKLTEKEQQLAETRRLLLDETRKAKELESENLRLQCLLAEKSETNNYTAPVSPDTIPEVIVHNQTPISPAKKTPKSKSKATKIQSSENDVVPHSSFQDEARELDCCRRHMGISGNDTDESSSASVYRMLAESLVGMKFSIKNEMEGFSLSVSHEASGYNFILAWVDQPDGGEWSYQHSSLGTLERISVGWMKQDIRFSMTMCPVFFQRVSHIIRQG